MGNSGRFSKTNQPDKSQSGNRLPQDLRMANKLTEANLRGIVNKLLWMTKDQLQAHVKNPRVPMIELTVASIIHKAAVQGDERRLDFILNRMIGRVRERFDFHNYVNHLEKLPDSQVIEMGKEAIQFLEKKNANQSH